MKTGLRVPSLARVGVIGLTSLVILPALASENGSSVEEIVVTGSRVISNGFAAPTPVTVLTADALAEKAPNSIPDALKQLPEFSGSSGVGSAQTATSTITAAAGTSSTSAGTYLNLRALGTNRMLTLQDGHRVPPNTSTGATDANLFPQMLVQRVDVVTGGASAAYGSDAVSGVVNFITDKKFEGIKGVMQGGSSSHGDMKSYRVGLAGGIGLMDDRLHLIGSAEHYDNDGIERNEDRPWGGSDYFGGGGQFGPVGAGTAANPYVVYTGVKFRLGNSFNGAANSGPLAGQQIINGQLVPLNQGTQITPAACTNCPDNFSVLLPHETLVPESKNDQFFGRAQFQINENVSAWAQASYAKSKVFGYGANAFLNGNITVFRENAYLPPAALAALGTTPSFIFSTTFDDAIIPLSTVNLEPSALNVLAGLEGKFGSSWNWDVTYADGKAETDFASHNQISYPRAYASFDAVTDPATGNIVCRVTLTNPGLYPGCAPFNLFGRNAESAAAAAYIQGTSTSHDEITERSGSVNLRGEPFSLWAGPVALAVGLEYRKQEYTLSSNSSAASIVNTGIRGVNNPTAFVIANTEPSSGSRDVKEGYVEVLIPLAKDLPLLQSLDLDAAARSTDYSTSGNVTTWKVGTNWQPFTDLRIRATASRDIRAPSLGELFTGQSRTANGPFTDPHTGASTIVVNSVIGGNPDLEPEESEAFTGGVVYTPSWAQGLHASVDYYRFEIKDAIANPFGPQQILNLCEASGGTDPLCDLIIRPLPFSDHTTANNATDIKLTNINVSSFTVSGVDAELGYARALGAGQIDARVLASYLNKYEQVNAPGQPARSFAGNADAFGGLPKLKGSVQVRYGQGPWSLSVQERVVGSLDISDLPSSVHLDNDVSAQFYTDLNATYDFQREVMKMQMFLNVSNLFDRQAPLIVGGGTSVNYPALRNIHDIVGTSFTAGVRFSF